MNKYTENWTREDFVEFRKLKRKGYTDDELIEHFGDVLYEDANIFNRNASILPPLYLYNEAIERMRKTPNKTEYVIQERQSPIYINKIDYISNILSYANGKDYSIHFNYNEINDIKTYNLLFLTLTQSMNYDMLLIGELKEDDLVMDINNIICDGECLKEVQTVIKNLVFTLKEVSDEKSIKTFSVKDIGSDKMIDLYKNIIYQSFDNINEYTLYKDSDKYYIFDINN